MKELILSPTKNKTKIEAFPTLKNCMADTKGLTKKLLPIIRFDGGIINKKWTDVPFCFVIQNVYVDRIDFRLEEGKYRLLGPLDLRKIEEYDESGVERGYMQTKVDTVEKISYQHTDRYSNEGLVLEEGCYSFDPNKRRVFEYQDVNGTSMPVRTTVQYFTGNGQWMDSETFTYHYDADGFPEKLTIHQPAQKITVTEELLYKNSRKGLTVSKKKAPHLRPMETDASGYSYSKVPFTLLFSENEAEWDVTKNDSTIYTYSKSRNPNFNKQDVIKRHAYDHFYELYSGFLKYTCEIGEDNKISVVMDEAEEFPNTISYQFRCPEQSSEILFSYAEKNDKKVVLTSDASDDKYTFEHLGKEIAVTWDGRYGIKSYSLPGKYSLQQAVMMVRGLRYFWCDDFEQERIIDHIMYPYSSNSSQLQFIYQKTAGGTERIIQQVAQEKTPVRGTIRLKKPYWQQNDDTPLSPDGEPMEFVGQLDHGSMFGTLYLFYSAKHQLVSQIFQCT